MMRTRVMTCVAVPLALVLGACQSGQCCKDGAANASALGATKAAFFAGWSKSANTPFTMEPLSKVACACDDFLSFDGMSQEKTVISGWKTYADIWGPGMNGFTTASLTEAKPLRTWAGDGVAVTASLAHIQGTMPNGQKLDMLGHLTLVYKWDKGAWHVVHEHMSMPVKE
ncbi:MAG: nuclear transport factor 2 family protein [Phycisphaerales bacterium]